MRKLRSHSIGLATCAVLIAAGSVADAQTVRSGGTANAQLLQQLQQLGSERTSLQTENAQLKKELDDLRKERDALKKGQQAVDQRAKASMAAALAQSATRRQTTEEELKQTKERTQELITKFRETVQTLREVETESTTAKQSLASRDRELQVCVDRNVALYKLNGEVLTRLEHQSAWSRVASVEPFTRLKRIELENLVDGYKLRADDQRAPAPATQPAAAAPPAAPQPAAPSK